MSQLDDAEHMDFFEQQERTRRKTRWLVGYFFLVVLVMVLVVYVVVATFVHLLEGAPVLQGFAQMQGMERELARPLGPVEILLRLERIGYAPWAFFQSLWNTAAFFWVGGVTLAIIGFATLYKIQELSQGGSVVGAMLGGRPLTQPGTDPDEQKLRHVVEEMAIASGTPVPEIYVLDAERGINAFAAGHGAGDLVIGVTRGALKALTREELQGVVAHEFSHILNGDTRLNMRLMGLSFGILCIAVLGRWLVQLTFGIRFDDDGDVRFGGLARGARGFAVAALGAVLLLVGSIGVFFSRLIKSAISRQREFLADAAAVQMTRNPLGLANALKKIGGSPRHARLRCAHAETASHLFFGNGLGDPWIRWLSTHPPLEERIRALDPSFDGTFPNVVLPEPPPGPARAKPEPALTPRRPGVLRPDHFIAAVGLPGVAHLEHAAALKASLPEPVIRAAADAAGAIAVVYALLLDREEATRTAQLELLTTGADPAVQSEFEAVRGPVTSLGVEARLPLLNLALPALRRLSAEQYARFTRTVQSLIESDHQLSLFEYTLQRMLRRHLQPFYETPRKPVIQYYVLKPLVPDCAVLLSALAHIGQDEPEAKAAAFLRGTEQLNAPDGSLRFLELNACNLTRIDAALSRLVQATPMIRKNVLYACAQTVAADGRVQEDEAELLRAIADALDCPVPPFVAEPPAGDTTPAATT